MFNLETLFAPSDEAFPEDPPLLEEVEPPSTPRESQSLPGPAELAHQLLAEYSDAERYALICELLRPPLGGDDPDPPEEPASPTPAVPELSALVGLHGRRNPALADDGWAVVLTRYSRDYGPPGETPRRVWTYGEVSLFLGCSPGNVSSFVSRAAQEQPEAEGVRLLSEDRSRAAERVAGQTVWTLLSLDGAA